MQSKPDWLKTKGYIHLTPNLSMKNWRSIVKKVEDPKFIKQYSFFPLIHRVIKERKYKKFDEEKHLPIHGKIDKAKKLNLPLPYRAHKHRNIKDNKIVSTRKDREIFYSSHFDSVVYSYYSYLINNLYCNKLREDKLLNDSVIAYRKIPLYENKEDSEGKSTIHFSKEVFDEIKTQSKLYGEVAVLAFDITNFFPTMNHEILKNAWINLVGEEDFLDHHYKIFNASTNYRYVNYHEVKRIENNNRNKGFNEGYLHNIRKKNGVKSVFGSYSDFRLAIKNKELKVYNPNYRKKVEVKGVPQGLPISATLANLYLLDFDKTIIDNLVKSSSAFYRRYSDDIIIVCPFKDISQSESLIMKLIQDVKLEISTHKTERYKFRTQIYNKIQDVRLECFLLNSEFNEVKSSRLIYLGFEFYGYQTLIKSANLSKFYRRLIKIVDRRAKRVVKAIQNEPTTPKAIFYNQIKKSVNRPIKDDSEKADGDKHYKKDRYFLRKDLVTGEFKLQKSNKNSREKPLKKKSTYMGYVKRCVKIHKTPSFFNQLRKRKYILYSAIKKKLKRYFQD